jgi:hypothetical protein
MQFHEGQEVEVLYRDQTDYSALYNWRKAKIVSGNAHGAMIEVQFPDGTRGVFDAEHIKAFDVPVIYDIRQITG